MPTPAAGGLLLPSAQLHPLLAPLREELALPATGVLGGAELAALTRRLAARLDLHPHAVHRPESRWWARLALTDAVEVWLLAWWPGQGTAPHDHDGAVGAMTVLHGALDEDLFEPTTAALRGRRHHRAGRTVVFPAHHAHAVRGAAGTVATSVHAYSPPLRDTRPLPVPAARG